MTEPATSGIARCLRPVACLAGGFAVWLVALAAMAVLPQDRAGTPRVAVPTGLLVLHQDPRTLETVPVRAIRPL